MIDTLFYFVDTEQEYRRQMQGENGLPGISPTTIVFVGDSREIYVNGKGYGKTSTNGLLASSEFDQWKGQLNERIDNVISNAASENEEARQKAEEDLEAAMTLVQSMMDTSAEEMADTIQSVRNQIQQAKTELQENIDSANENADEILSALTTFQGTIRNELETSIRDAITNANGRTIWSELNTTNEGITAMTNRIDQSLNPDGSIKNTQVLQSIIDSGVRNNSAITDIQNKWAVMDDNQQVIEWVASGFKSQAGNEGGLAAVFATAQNNTQNAISAMKTEIEQDVAGNYVASADLGTSVIGIVEDELQVESLSALAMKSDVNSATTTITNRLNTIDTTTGNLLTSLSLVSSVAEEGKARASLLTSVGENGTYLVNESSLDGAMSNILTKSESGSATLIHQMAKKDIAAADISSQIDEATSVLATKVEVNKVVNDLTGEIETRKTAIAGLQAQITGEDGLTSTIAGVEARVTDNEASLTSLAQWKDDTLTWKAGVVQTANLDGAVAGLIADGTKESGKKVKASVIATVNDDTSAIKLNADHVFVDANKTTTIGSHYDNAYNPAKNGVNTSIATLKTNTDNDRATLTAISTWKDNKGYVADAGLVTDANKDGAMAALFAENSNSNTKAAVAAIVDDGLSTVTLTADRVFIEGKLNVNIQSYYDGEIENIGRDIDTLEGSIATNATSIAAINTKAEKNKSDISALTTWKNNTESWKSGVQTTAGLGGAVATLFAANANTDAKANVTAMVDGKLSTLKLSADKVYIEGNQGVNIKSYFDSGLNTATNNLSTSIAAVDTKAEANKSSISSLTTWKNNTESWKAGVQTSAGLDGAVAALFAENANTSAKAGVEAVVDGKSSTLTLTADLIKLDAQRTLANTIEATLGHIGGMNIANSSLSSSNGNFSVSSAGKLVAKNAEITGAITATSLSLGSNKISTSNISGLSTVATSGKYTDLSGKPSIPTKISDLNDDVTILKASDVSVSTATSSNGVTTKTITVGGKTYTSITDGDFVLTNIGYGNKSNTYASISSNGLLEARNAIIYGTVYASAGQVAGFTIEEPTNAAANIHYGVASMSDSSHDGVYMGTDGIRLGKGTFSVSDKGVLNATGATISGAITATSLTLSSGTKLPASSVSGLSAIATSGNYNDLSNKPTIPTVPNNILTTDSITTSESTDANGIKTKTINVGNKTYTTISDNNGFIYTNVGVGTKNSDHTSSYFKLSTEGLLEANNALIYGTIYATNGEFTGAINATSLNLVGSTKIDASKVNGLSAVATSGSYTSLSGKPTIPTKLSLLTNDKNFIDNTALNGYALAANVPTSVTQLTGGANILHTTDITTSETTDPNTGIKTKTINLGDGKTYTTISDNNGFIYTDVGYGTQDTQGHTTSYFQVSTDGLLTANNAVIYGTVYATNGSFSGTVESASGHIGGIKINNGSISSDNNKFSLTSAGVLTATDATIKGSIETEKGSIGGFTIGKSNIRNGMTSLSDTTNNGVYLGTDGIALGKGKFKVASDGALTASNATITGTINATSLNLVGDTKLDYSKLSNTPTIPSKLSQLTNDKSFIDSSALTGYAKTSDIPTVPTSVTELTGGANIVHTTDITTSETTVNGVKVKTISLGGGKSYSTISDNNGFVYTNVGVGTQDTTDHSTNFFQISSNGLLQADNAIIHGTLYANAGQVAGFAIEEPTNASANIHYGMTSLGDTTHNGVYVGTNGIALGKGNFKVTDAGEITATSGTIGGYTINSENLTCANNDGDTSVTIYKNINTHKFTLDDDDSWSYVEVTQPALIAVSSRVVGLGTPQTKRVYDKMILSPAGLETCTGMNAGKFGNETITNYIGPDGAGFIGRGALSWNSNGEFSTTEPFRRVLFAAFLEGIISTDTYNSGRQNHYKKVCIDEDGFYAQSARFHDSSDISAIYDYNISINPTGIEIKNESDSDEIVRINREGLSIGDENGEVYSEYNSGGAYILSDDGFVTQIDPELILFSTTGGVITQVGLSGATFKTANNQSKIEITPTAIKVTKNGTEKTGLTLDFTIKGIGYLGYDGKNHEYVATLNFTNGILTGYKMHNSYPGNTSAQVSSNGLVVIG